jgi:hypothetical protein
MVRSVDPAVTHAEQQYPAEPQRLAMESANIVRDSALKT